jgi:hypothetical protein
MRHAAFAVLVLVSLGCGGLRDQFVDMAQLNAALQAQYKVQIGVNVMNGNRLSLAVPIDATDKLSDDARHALALSIAKFAFAHYGHPANLRTVTVQFVATKSYGALNYTRTFDGGSWSTWELAGPTTPRDAAHADRQVVWVAIGDRNASARLDVDESRLERGQSGDTPEDIFIRVKYDSAVTTPVGQLVASIEIHYQVTCATAASTLLGVNAFDAAEQPVSTGWNGDSLATWMEPPGMQATRAAVRGYCRTFHPDRHFGS